MSPAQQRARTWPAIRASKYKAIPTMLDGIRFASKAEARCYAELKLRVLAGEIIDLVAHPKWIFTINGVRVGSYSADFQFYHVATEARRVIDVKSAPTAKLPAFRRSVKMMKAMFGIDVEVWQGGKEPAA